MLGIGGSSVPPADACVTRVVRPKAERSGNKSRNPCREHLQAITGLRPWIGV